MSESENGKPDTGATPEAPKPGTEEVQPTSAELASDSEEAKAAAAARAKAEAAAKRAAAEAAKPAWEKDPVTPEWQEADQDPLVQALRGAHGEALQSSRLFAGDLVLEVAREEIRNVCRTLKEAQGFTLLVDLLGAHFPDREEDPFEVVYILYSLDANRRVRLKVRTAEDVDVPSVTPVFAGANWPEREAYDMYGIRFEQHPDMTRILLWEGFNGYPLRKDFPVEGIDTGAAIYPEFYGETAGPVAGTGTGWRPPEPPADEESESASAETAGDEA
jgi:NADH-quinone oxidoreductase subunit C